MILPVGFDAVRWIPNLCRIFLPITFCGRLFASRILLFFADHGPDLRITSSTPFIWRSWLLKHLYLVFSGNFVIFVSGYSAVIFFAVDSCINDLGDPVLANHSISLFRYFVLTQNSPLMSLFNDTLFTSLKPVGCTMLMDDQSSMSSLMYNAASPSTVSSSCYSSSCSSWMLRTLRVCLNCCWGVFLFSCRGLNVFLLSGMGVLHKNL